MFWRRWPLAAGPLRSPPKASEGASGDLQESGPRGSGEVGEMCKELKTPHPRATDLPAALKLCNDRSVRLWKQAHNSFF